MEEVFVRPTSVKKIIAKTRTFFEQKKYQEAIVSADEGLKVDEENVDVLDLKLNALRELSKHEEALLCVEKILIIDPRHLDALCKKAHSFACLKKHEKAIVSAEEALKVDEGNIWVLGIKANSFFHLNKYPESLSSVEEVLKADATNVEALWIKACALFCLGRHQESLASVELALKINEENFEFLDLKLELLRELEKYEEAIVCAEKILKVDSKNLSALTVKVQSLFSLARYQETIVSAEAALKVGEKDLEMMDLKAESLRKLSKYEEALVSVEEILKVDSLNLDALCKKADILIRLERHQESLESADAALKVDAKNLWAADVKAHSLFYLRRYQESLSAAVMALQFDEKSLWALNIKSGTFLKLGRYQESLESAEEALKVDATHSGALCKKADSLFYLGKYQESLHTAEIALKLEEENVWALDVKAQSLLKLRKYKEALLGAEEVLKVDEKHQGALRVKASSLRKLGRNEEAIVWADALLKINGKDFSALHVKASALHDLDRHQEALLSAEEALKINVNNLQMLIIKTFSLFLLNRWNESLLCADEILKLDEKNLDVLSMKVIALLRLERCGQALLSVEDALKFLGKQPSLVALKAEVLYAMDGCWVDSLLCAEEALRMNEKDLMALRVKAKSLWRLRRYQDAVVSAEEELKIDGKSNWAWFVKADSLKKLARYDEAIVCAEAALKIDPVDQLYWETKASSLLNLGRPQESLECAEEGLKIARNNLTLLSVKAKSLFDRLIYKDALYCAEEVLKIQESHSEAFTVKVESIRHFVRAPEARNLEDWFERAELFWLHNEFEGALKYARKILRVDPKNIKALCIKASSLYLLQREILALITVNEILKFAPRNLNALVLKTFLAFGEQKYAEVVVCADRLLQVDQNEATILGVKAHALKQLKKEKKAQECVEKAYTVEASYVSEVMKQSRLLQKFLQFRKEITVTQEILNKDSKNIQALWVMANAWKGLREYKKALLSTRCSWGIFLPASTAEALANAVDKEACKVEASYATAELVLFTDPYNIYALLTKAEYLLSENKIPEALHCIEAVLKIDPSHPDAHFIKIQALNNLGGELETHIKEEKIINPQEVMDRVMLVLEGEPYYVEAWNLKMMWLKKQKRYEEMLMSAEKILEIDDSHPSALLTKMFGLWCCGRKETAAIWAHELLSKRLCETDEVGRLQLFWVLRAVQKNEDALLLLGRVRGGEGVCGPASEFLFGFLTKSALLAQCCDYKTAQASLEEIINVERKLFKRSEEKERLSASPYFLAVQGVTLFCRGHYDDAVESFKKVLKKYPENISALQGMGVWHLYTGKREISHRFLHKVDDLIRARDEAPDDMLHERAELFFAIQEYQLAADAYHALFAEARLEKYSAFKLEGVYAKRAFYTSHATRRLQEIQVLQEEQQLDLEKTHVDFEERKAIAQEEHQPEVVAPPSPAKTYVISAAPEEGRRKSNLECVYLPEGHHTSEKTPSGLFMVHPIMGGIAELKAFSNQLNKKILDKNNLAVYLWRSPVLSMNCEEEGFEEAWKVHCSMEKQAEVAIAEIKAKQPHGPYYVGGWSYGGVLAVEIARQLQAQGEKVKYMALIDPQTPAELRKLNQASLRHRILQHVNYISGLLLELAQPMIHLDDAEERNGEALIHFAFAKVLKAIDDHKAHVGYKKLKRVLYALYANYLAIYGYYPENLLKDGERLPAATVYVASDKPEVLEKKEYSFADLAGVTHVKLNEPVIKGTNHFDIVLKPQMANLLSRHLKDIGKIKLSNKLWTCLERHYKTRDFSSLQFLYDDVPFDVRECDFNVSASTPDVRFDSVFEEASVIRHALVVGDAGIGKTILSRQSTLRNVDSQLWKQKKWLFYIPLQNLAAMDPAVFETHQLVEHLLYHGIFKVFGISLEEVSIFWRFIKKEPQSICFIVDGLDELPESEQLNNVLKALFLLESSSVLTTRNYRTSRLRTLGFTPEVRFTVKSLDEKPLREVFIPKYFKKRKQEEFEKREGAGNTLLAWIARYPLMQEFTETPLHLTMLCSLWDRHEKEMEEGEMSLMDIFSLSVKNMFRRFLVHERLAKTYDLNNLTDDEIEQMTQDVSAFLALCAFERIHSGCRGFTSKHLNQLLTGVKGGKNLFAKVLDSGFILATTNAQYDLDKNFQFNSEAMELYFGCQYVIKRLNAKETLADNECEQIKEFIKNVGGKFEPLLLEALLVRELTAIGSKRFVTLSQATGEKKCDFNSLRVITCALEGILKASEDSEMNESTEAKSDADIEPEIPEEVGEVLYCFSSFFSEAYPYKNQKDRPNVDSRELSTFKDQIEALKIQSPEVFERVAKDERFIRPYKGNEGVLHYAVRRGSMRLLTLLLTLNPNLALKNDEGFTPVTLAQYLKFDAGLALLNAYAELKAKQEKHRGETREKIKERYVGLWRGEKLKEVDNYLEEKIASCQKMNFNGALAVKKMAEIFDLFKYMESYAKDEVFQEALCELIKSGRHDGLTKKVLNFYDEIFSGKAVPKEYGNFDDELNKIIRKERKNVRYDENWHDALKIAVKHFAQNKNWLSDFLQNVLEEIFTDNFTKALLLTHLIQKYKRNELFEKWSFSQKLKNLVWYICEKCYKHEIDIKVEEEMNPSEENQALHQRALAALEVQQLVVHSIFQSPMLLRARAPQSQFTPRLGTGNSAGK